MYVTVFFLVFFLVFPFFSEGVGEGVCGEECGGKVSLGIKGRRLYSVVCAKKRENPIYIRVEGKSGTPKGLGEREEGGRGGEKKRKVGVGE